MEYRTQDPCQRKGACASMTSYFELMQRAIRQHRLQSRLIRKSTNLSIEPHVIVKGDINNISLGKNVIIQSGTVLHLGGLEWCKNAGHLRIGDDSCISPNCTLYGTGPGGITIGDRFDCGPGVRIFSSRTDYESVSRSAVFAPVIIGDDVIVYSNVVISPGVSIGNRSVIAAGSVITRDVPSDCLAGGTPGKVIKEINRRS